MMPMTALFGPGSMPKNNRGFDEDAIEKSYEERIREMRIAKEFDLKMAKFIHQCETTWEKMVEERKQALGTKFPSTLSLPAFGDARRMEMLKKKKLEISEAITYCLQVHGPMKYGQLVEKCLELPNFTSRAEDPKNSIQTVCDRMKRRGTLLLNKKTHLYSLPE